jgi:hypothetical protein
MADYEREMGGSVRYIDGWLNEWLSMKNDYEREMGGFVI